MLRWKIMQKLVDLVLPGYFIIYPPYEYVEVRSKEATIRCGSGPETAIAGTHDNPNWHYTKAANEVALAKWLEKRGR